MSTSSVTVKGQVTIPLAIRKQLRIRPGDKVQFVEMEGRVYLKRGERDVAAAFGLLKARKSVRQADIDKAILKGWSRRARG